MSDTYIRGLKREFIQRRAAGQDTKDVVAELKRMGAAGDMGVETAVKRAKPKTKKNDK